MPDQLRSFNSAPMRGVGLLLLVHVFLQGRPVLAL